MVSFHLFDECAFSFNIYDRFNHWNFRSFIFNSLNQTRIISNRNLQSYSKLLWIIFWVPWVSNYDSVLQNLELWKLFRQLNKNMIPVYFWRIGICQNSQKIIFFSKMHIISHFSSISRTVQLSRNLIILKD